MTSIQIEVPDSVFSSLRKTPDELSKEVQFLAVANWYDTNQIGITEAIKMTGHTYQSFIRALKILKKVPPQPSTPPEKMSEAERKSHAEQMMKFAGSWSDMSDADFEEFLQDIYKRRQGVFTLTEENS